MSSLYESADLLMKLYDLRREATMREARGWYFREFHPASADDMLATLGGPHSGHFRMVTSYWDMAASFVLNGAIDEQTFNDANGEQIGVFAKIEPFLTDYRTKSAVSGYMRASRKWCSGDRMHKRCWPTSARVSAPPRRRRDADAASSESM